MNSALLFPPLGFFNMGPAELVLLGILALLLFGGDLPDVARTWGKYLAEFRRHVNGIREDLNAAIYAEPETPRLAYHPPAYGVEPGPPTIVDAVVEGDEIVPDQAPTESTDEAGPRESV